VAAAAGPVLGGLLTQAGWRLSFFVNLPVGLAAIGFLTQAAPSPRRAVRFDWTGQVTAFLALGALTYALIEGGSAGFGASRIIAAFLISAASFTVFFCSIPPIFTGSTPAVRINRSTSSPARSSPAA
jgi:MFS transporter, DHA2 family, methylenomycin A resistance protein